MDKTLTVANLETELKSLVQWETFGTHLRGMTHDEIEKITRDKPTTDEQKLALYSKWLSVCPNPSWRDVAIALEKGKEIALAGRIALLIAREMSPNEEGNKIVVTLKKDEEETVITTLKELHLSFTRIFGAAKIEIEKLIKFKKKTLQDCLSLIKAALVHISIPGLKSCTTISEIFDILREHTNFMDGSLLEGVIEHVIGQSRLLQDINEHIQKANKFKSSTPIQALKNKLQEFDAVKNQTKVIIQINQSWGEFYVGLVEALIKKILKIKGELHWLTVESGSIQITIAISTDSETETIDNCSQQLQLAQLMGVIMIQIHVGSHPAVVNISENNNADYTFERAILEASRVGNIEAVQLLLEMGIDADHTDQQGQTPLIIASKNGHGNIVKHLLTTTGVNVNKQDSNGQTAVMVAKTIDIYQTLVQANADTSIVSHNGSTPLMASCILGNHEVANHLLFTLKHNITTRPDGVTLLIAASNGGNNEIVEHLLANGHHPNIQDNNGNTAIKASCLNGHYAVTETHLEYNADPNIVNRDGWTPLMAASLEGHHKIVELLLQKQVDPNVTNENGQTALMIASVNGHNEVVELLLINGAEPNAQDDDGYTAIELSCLNNHYTVTKTLLKHNADPTIADNDGYTPLMVALEEGHHKIVKLLRKVARLIERNLYNISEKAIVNQLDEYYDSSDDEDSTSTYMYTTLSQP